MYNLGDPESCASSKYPDLIMLEMSLVRLPSFDESLESTIGIVLKQLDRVGETITDRPHEQFLYLKWFGRMGKIMDIRVFSI